MAVLAVNGTSINTAIGKAAPGDTIDIAAGGYAPFLVPSTKRLTLVGAGDNTRIEGPGKTAIVRSAGTKLSGMDIAGSTGLNNSCLSIETGAHDVVLDHVGVHHSEQYGLRVYQAARLRWTNGWQYEVAAGRFDHDGAGSVIEDLDSHDINRMLVNDPTPNTDTGAMALAFYKTKGTITVRRIRSERAYSVARNGLPASYDYGWDGAHFELFACGRVVVEDSYLRGAPWVMETGRNSGDPDCAAFEIRRSTIYGFSPDPVSVHTKAAHGFLLRSLVEGIIEDNEIYDLDWHVILAESKGNYPGRVGNVVVRRNAIRLKPGDNRLISLGENVPATALTLSENRVDPNGSTAVAYVIGRGKTTSREQLVAWTGWERDSVWGPLVPQETEVERLNRELAEARDALTSANAALVAADKARVDLTADRDRIRGLAVGARTTLAAV